MMNSNKLDFLSKFHDEVIILAPKLKFDPQRESHSAIMMLLLSIVEMSGSCILLFQNKQITTIPILLRFILEALVDLRNLTKDENYFYNMRASYLHELKKIFPITDEEKQQLQKMGNFIELDEIEDFLKVHKKKGIKVLSKKKNLRKQI